MQSKKRLCHLMCLLIVVNCALMYASSVSATIPVDSLIVHDTIFVGGIPTVAAATPDGKKLYVVNTPPESPESPNGQGSVLVINTTTKTLSKAIPLDIGFPQGITIAPDGSRVYVTVSQASGSAVSDGPNRLEVIDIASDTVLTSIPIGGDVFGPIGVAITPDGSLAYVTHRGNGDVIVINTRTNTTVTSVSLGSVDPIGIAITSDGRRAYVAIRGNSTVAVIETTHNTVETTIPLSIGPSDDVTSIAITPDGRRVYITYADDSRIAIIDTEPTSPLFHHEVGLITTTGANLWEIALSSDGELAFVTSRGTNELLVIDINARSANFHTQVGSVSVGNDPYGIAFHDTPSTVVYVINSNGGSVSVVGPGTMVNDLVAFEPIPSTYQFTPDPTGCPAGFVGRFRFEARLTNISTNTLSHLQVEVEELTRHNLLLSDTGLLGAGESFPVPMVGAYADGALGPDEFVEVPFTVCLQVQQPFVFLVNVLGKWEIRVSYFYSFLHLSGTTTLTPRQVFTIYNEPGGCGPVFRDIAQCEANEVGQVRAINHDCLSGADPGTFGPFVRSGCSQAVEFGFTVECCILP